MMLRLWFSFAQVRESPTQQNQQGTERQQQQRQQQ
jgi:hypothetical protein